MDFSRRMIVSERDDCVGIECRVLLIPNGANDGFNVVTRERPYVLRCWPEDEVNG